MPTREAPASGHESAGTSAVSDGEGRPQQGSLALAEDPAAESNGNGARIASTSRWIDYDTHELLEMISELEDERRWARLREGVLWAVLIHIVLIFALFLLPKYVNLAPVIDTNNIRDHKDFTYLDTPYLPKPKPVKPLTHPPVIDNKTLQELKRETQAPPAPTPPPTAEQPKVQPEPKPQPPPPIPPSPQSQSPVEAPRPQAVPARPNFALSQNPNDQLQEAMRNAMRNRGSGSDIQAPSGGLAMHPGAGTGGVEILSNTQGVDFSSWLAAWHYDTEQTWDPLIPDEVNPPILKSGMVAIEFKVLPNGRLMPGSVQLVGRSGDVALDRAAWGALTGSSYPPLPRDFHGPYIQLRAYFLYNMQPPH
jgi:outer membrane biosynthesis protein TonB